MTILILTLGSRGDVQPYLALGRGLEDAGHDVTISTSASFASSVTDYGMSFYGLTDGFIDLMKAAATGEAMEELATFWVPGVSATRAAPLAGVNQRPAGAE
jgi:sterol 3beta-glucosyltransferase